MVTRRTRPLSERLFEKVDAEGICWIWTRSRNVGGYGVINVSREQGVRVVHRVVWELLVGAIPDDLELDHLCRVRQCCNPDHLEPVTRKVNVDRGSHRAGAPRRDHCLNGHEMTAENTRQGNQQRVCRTCAIEANRRYRARKAVAA